MAANTLVVSYTELQDEAQRALGWRKAAASWSATQTADFGAAVESAQRWSYYPPILDSDRARGMVAPHVWSHMISTPQTLTIRAPYSTGTVTIVAGVVTGSGLTWPSWAASGDLWVSGVRYDVSTRDSNTQITLADTSVTASAGTSYDLIQHYYTLPSDFGSLVADGFTYPRAATIESVSLRRVPERMVRELDRDFGSTSWPCEYALSWFAPTSTDDARQRVQFFPLTNADRTLEYRYEVIPVQVNGSSVVYHHGGPWFGELLIKATVAELAGKLLGRESARYQALHADRMNYLETCVGFDRRTAAVASLGRPPSDDAVIEDALYEVRRNIPWSAVTIDV